MLQLARKYKHDWRVVKNILKSVDEYRIERPAALNHWNQNFFNEINPTTAYWAGFGFADGCVRKLSSGTRFHIIIAEKDRSHIEDFANTIGFPIEKIIKGKTRSRTIQVFSNGSGLMESLKKWGIVERKTYNFVEPQVPKELIPHFLRGWFDGDGCVTHKPGQQRFDIVGNALGIDWYISQLRELGFCGHVNFIQKEGKHWKHALITGGNQIKQVAEMIRVYDSESPKLMRKWLPLLSKQS